MGCIKSLLRNKADKGLTIEMLEAEKGAASSTSSLSYSEKNIRVTLKLNKLKVFTSLFIPLIHTSPYDYYETIREIGGGSSAKVFKVRKIKTNFIKALKAINLDSTSNLYELLSEISILKEFSHPNIMKIYECFLLDGQSLNIITEVFPDGEVFSKLSRLHNFTEENTAKIMAQLFSAIKLCHEHGVVHRDIKSENILFSDENAYKVKIIDFGTAQKLSPGEYCDTKVGTPNFIAPEILKGEKYDFKCDIWSLGVLMYTLLSGSKPFNSQVEKEIFNLILKTEPTFKEKEWKTISEDAKKLIKGLLTKDPKKRMNAAEALNHPWIKKYYNKSNLRIDLNKGNFIGENINKFNPSNILQVAACFYLVYQMTSDESEEMKNILAFFDYFDKDYDGRLSRTELIEGLSQIYNDKAKAENEAKKLLTIFTDGTAENAFIELEDFIVSSYDLKELISTENIQETFKVLDPARSGKITYAGLKQVLIPKEKECLYLNGESLFRAECEKIGLTQETSISYSKFAQLINDLKK